MSSGQLEYLPHELESEAEGYRGALPRDCVNPQRCKFGLVAEQLSGSAFTAPRDSNKRSWLYRFKPSARHWPAEKYERQLDYESGQSEPNQRRWKPFELPSDLRGRDFDFIDGLRLLAYSGSSQESGGQVSLSVSIFIYFANRPMTGRSMMNADGDFLFVPQEGTLLITTEFGTLQVAPNEIAVVQLGMKFQVDYICDHPAKNLARGYILEVTGNHFELPYRGPIGANCLANKRDFLSPRARVASQTDAKDGSHQIVTKYERQLYSCEQDHSPYDVAAWFGDYVPYKYDLSKFVSVNSVSVDHPDPSIFTVLTCPSFKPGTALADFVIFPPRWECANGTFRPPYYHRNCMTEFMGLIKGKYQAKSSAFAPGGASLHQAMSSHGPDNECFRLASEQDTSKPARVADDTMAFMFETSFKLKLTKWARDCNVDNDYHKCWIDS